MHMHDGTTDFLKWCLWIGATFVSVSWVAGIIGGEATLIAIGAVILVIVFALGALFAHGNQKMTLDALNKSNAADAQIDRYRMQSLKHITAGDSAMQRAAAQMTVLDARRVDKLAEQRAKVLIDNQQPRTQDDLWEWDKSDSDAFAGWD